MIKAFTYLELIVVIILTSVIVSAGYYAISILGKQNTVVSNKQQEIHDLSLFDLQLKKAFSNAVEMNVFENSIQLKSPNGEEVFLEVASEYLIYSGDNRDSLYCKVDNLQDFFNPEKSSVDFQIQYMNQAFELNYFID